MVSSANISHAVSCDSTDSGHASGADARSSVSQSSSPPNQRRSYPPLMKQLSSTHTAGQQATTTVVSGTGPSNHRSAAAVAVSSAGLRYMHGKIPAVAAEFYSGSHVRRTTSGPSTGGDSQLAFGQDGKLL